MENIQEPRATRSNGNVSDITSMAGDPDHILCNSINPLFSMGYASPGLTMQNMQENVENLAHVLESKDGRPLSVPVQGQDS